MLGRETETETETEKGRDAVRCSPPSAPGAPKEQWGEERGAWGEERGGAFRSPERKRIGPAE